MSAPPSGHQFEIGHGPQRAVVVEVGGGIRDYRVDGRPVLDGYPVDEMCGGARGTPLLPWPNRLADGKYSFDGVTHQLPLTEPSTGTAIHGLTRWTNWTAREHSGHRVALATVLRPQPGYPFTLELTVDYTLDDRGLTVATTAVNAGEDRCPYAAGQHPYLTVGTELIDPCLLELEADLWLPVDERGLPTGREPVAGSHLDFRTPRRIADTVIDNAFTDLARDADQRAWLALSGPDGRTVRVWVDEHYRYLEVYTGDTQPPDVRRHGLGVEPMTCPPNGFASGEGLLVLGPGESITTRWGIRPDLDVASGGHADTSEETG
jgi:aldose 1-epimerase